MPHDSSSPSLSRSKESENLMTMTPHSPTGQTPDTPPSMQLWLSILLSTIVAIILIISGITYYLVKQNNMDEQGKTLATIATALGKRLDRILFERQADISVLAKTPILGTHDRTAIIRHLQIIQDTYQAYNWIGITDEKGQVVAATIPSTIGIIMNQNPAFQTIQQSPGIYIEDAKPRDILNEQLALLIAIAVQPDQSATKGAPFKKGIFAYISLEYLGKEFNRQTAVLRQQYPMTSMLEWQLLRRDGLILFDSGTSDPGPVNLQALNLGSAQSVAKGQNGYMQEFHLRRKIDVLTGFSQMKGSGLASTFNWGILVRRDRNELLAASHALLWEFAAAVIFLLLLIGLLAWSMKRLQRAQELERAANRLAQRAEQRFRTIVETAPSGIVMIDQTGTIVLANTLLCQQFGYTSTELLHQSIEILIPERFRKNHPAHLGKYFTAPEPRSLMLDQEPYGLHRNGTEFPVEIGLNPLTTDEGNYALASVIDVSERKHAEKELQGLHRTKELILNSAGEGIYGVDVNGNTIFVNVAAASLLGYRPEELIGTPMHSMIHHTKPDGSVYAYQDCPIHQTFECGTIQTIKDELLWHKDGTSISVEYTSVPIRNESNEIEGAVVTVQDITEQKKHQNEIALLSESLQIATQAAEIGVWDWNIVENALTWDDRMYALYGEPSGSTALSYEVWRSALHPHDDERVHGELQDALQHQTHFRTHFRIIWPDHSIHYIQVFAVIHRDQTGTAIRMTGVNWDITREKINEEALAKNIEDLRRSNAELEQFAYVASHDLQEPLRKIRNFSELLRERAKHQLPSEFEKLLAPIVNGAMRMQDLVQDLLTYSRVSREGRTAELVDLQVIAENVKNTLESAIAESHATITIGALPTLEAHATHIEQLFQNLISNSLKYHGSQPPRIEISATKIKKYWQFSIRDNGIGIDPQYAERIFVIFQRLHTKQEFAGTGIGLAICKKIIERHEGQIWVESKLHEGSTFFFTLPQSLHNSQTVEHTRESFDLK